LQRALGIPDDGILGPRTIAAANAADPVSLLADIRTCGTHFYCSLAESKPELAPNLPGWLARLNS
jgi:lysozyme family protein